MSFSRLDNESDAVLRSSQFRDVDCNKGTNSIEVIQINQDIDLKLILPAKYQSDKLHNYTFPCNLMGLNPS